jgi:hypothetical protein
VLLLVFGILSFLGVHIPNLGFQLIHISSLYSGIVAIICGVIAIVGAKRVTTIVWAVVLIVVGVIGGGIGGLLVIVGGIIGLVLAIMSKA